MRGKPPERLVDLLEHLGLASADEVSAVRGRVRRLAGELPDFESVWVDALAQARVITPYQASQINAGRGESLRFGPYVTIRPLASPHYAACFAARHVETRGAVRLYVARCSQTAASLAECAVNELAEKLNSLRGTKACVVDDAGHEGDRIWAACQVVDGTTAADWMVENGRFPPNVVLHVAREMVARLSALERFSQAHGDIGASSIVLQSSGYVLLPMPGLRGIVRPAEGYSFHDLPPEAYDYLAPERISESVAPSLAGDVYACGALWWHLLTGRPPFGGGNSLARLRAAHAARVADVRQLAPEVPDALAGAIQRCMTRDPAARPRAMTELASLLGSGGRRGSAALARSLTRPQRPLFLERQRSLPAKAAFKRRALAAAGVMALMSVILAVRWPAPGADSRRVRAQSATSLRVRQPGKPEANRNVLAARAVADSTSRRDPAVALATAVDPADSSLVKDLVLSPDDGWHFDARALEAGQRIRGPLGTRPRITIPRGGLIIGCDARFENVDFVCEPSAADVSRPGPMIMVAASSVAWQGCSFVSHARTPVAIGWRGPVESAGGAGGELLLRDCVVSGVAAVVDRSSATNLSVRLNNCLCVDAGPIVRLHGRPAVDERVVLVLDHTTARGDTAVLEWQYGRERKPLGSVDVSVIASALDPVVGGGLLLFRGAQRPDDLLAAVHWMGEGSLVTPQATVAVWRNREGEQQVLAEDALEIAGLVRSRVEFAGEAQGPPSASRLRRWQAPLRSAEAPGIDDKSLQFTRGLR